MWKRLLDLWRATFRGNWNEADAIVLGLILLMALTAFILPGAPNVPTPVLEIASEEPGHYCDTACEREERDLQAQVDMANAAWAMWWIAFFSFWVGTGTLFLVWRTVEHTKAAATHAKTAAEAAMATNEITKTAFLTDQRPWVNIDVSVVTDVLFDENGMSFGVKIVITNVGKSPATSVFVVTSIDVEEPGKFKDLKAKMMMFWTGQQNIRVMDPNNWGLQVGDVVFPGEARTRTYHLSVPKKKLEIGLAGGKIMPGIIAVCTYGPEPQGRYFSTVRLFHMNGPGNPDKVHPIPLLEVGTIPQGQVSTSSAFSAAYAT